MKNLKQNLLVLAGFLVFSPITHAKQVQGINERYSDWDMLCNNSGTCYATGYQLNEFDDLPASILLERRAGAMQPVQVKFLLSSYDDDDSNKTKPPKIDFFINNKNLGRVEYKNEEGNFKGVLNSAQRNMLLQNVTKNINIEFKSDNYAWTISDQGLTAALVKMDDFQKRVGTVGALVKKGRANESQVLQASARPVVKKVATADRPYKTLEPNTPDYTMVHDKLRKALNPPSGESFDSCYLVSGELDMEYQIDEDLKIELYKLSNGKVLAVANCWRAAYNFGYGAWVMDESLQGEADMLTDSMSWVESGGLAAAHKGRGVGDCFSGSGWTWDGVNFVLTSDWHTGRCKGVPGGTWRLDRLDYEVK